jgi:tetratricopeptide (TPR) repeat protein
MEPLRPVSFFTNPQRNFSSKNKDDESSSLHTTQRNSIKNHIADLQNGIQELTIYLNAVHKALGSLRRKKCDQPQASKETSATGIAKMTSQSSSVQTRQVPTLVVEVAELPVVNSSKKLAIPASKTTYTAYHPPTPAAIQVHALSTSVPRKSPRKVTPLPSIQSRLEGPASVPPLTQRSHSAQTIIHGKSSRPPLPTPLEVDPSGIRRPSSAPRCISSDGAATSDTLTPSRAVLGKKVNYLLLRSHILRIGGKSLGLAYWQATEALKIAEAQNLHAEVAKAQFYRGRVLYALERFEEASVCFTRAASVRGDLRDVAAWKNRAEKRKRKEKLAKEDEEPGVWYGMSNLG